MTAPVSSGANEQSTPAYLSIRQEYVTEGSNPLTKRLLGELRARELSRRIRFGFKPAALSELKLDECSVCPLRLCESSVTVLALAVVHDSWLCYCLALLVCRKPLASRGVPFSGKSKAAVPPAPRLRKCFEIAGGGKLRRVSSQLFFVFISWTLSQALVLLFTSNGLFLIDKLAARSQGRSRLEMSCSGMRIFQ